MRPTTLYGEATGPYLEGVPTVTAIAAPAYLLRVTEDGGLDRLDPDLLLRQTRFLTCLTSALVSAEELGGIGLESHSEVWETAVEAEMELGWACRK